MPRPPARPRPPVLPRPELGTATRAEEGSRHLIRDLPEHERPRERLLEQGGRTLSDSELLAVVLRTGTRGSSAIDLARQLLWELGGLEGLLDAQPASLRRKGLGEAKAAGLLATLEIARRLSLAEIKRRDPLTCPRTVTRYLFQRYGNKDQEVFGALFLDVKNKLISERELFRGALNRATVDPRPILKAALMAGAASLIVFHTHPSGDPTPSMEDQLFTERLVDACNLLGLVLRDHIVIGGQESWTSVKDYRPW
jgi:DNA repair protein RadC